MPFTEALAFLLAFLFMLEAEIQSDNSFKGIKTLLGDVETAPYTVIADHKTYEERLYGAKKWVKTSKDTISWKESSSILFRRLFNYISGDNEKNMKVDMTTPVTNYVIPGAGPTCESTFTMAFFVPEVHQSEPPKPSESNVSIEDRQEMKIFTRRFPGYATDDIVAKEAAELAEILKQANESANFERYYIVGYDPPFKPINRRNEIWFVKNE